MVIVMRRNCPKREIGGVLAALRDRGYEPRVVSAFPRVALGIVEDLDCATVSSLTGWIEPMSGVESVETFDNSWKLAARTYRPSGTTVRIGKVLIGGGRLHVIAGPCAVESRESIMRIARVVLDRGGTLLRGGAFKPRTSPYSFRGLGREGLEYLAEASSETGLPCVTEVLSVEDVDLVAAHADVLQIGARNMQNYTLLEAVGDTDRPVLLKRGMNATVKELLLAAEYILARGNPNVMLCERGIRTFETATRNTLDISAIPLLHELTHLPVVTDPSHATGLRELVTPAALAAVAAGTDALMVEIHTNPSEALSDGRQSLDPDGLGVLVEMAREIHAVVGRMAV